MSKLLLPFRKFLDFWFAPIAPERFVLWQRAFALTFIIFIAQWSMYGREWLTDYGYHVSLEATDSVYPDPFPLLPASWLAPFLGIMFGSAVLLVLDYGGRVAKFICLACAVYIQLADQVSSFTLNKLYIVGFALIAFAPSPRDVRGFGSPRQSAWPVRTIQATLIIQYFDAGLCKAYHGDWLQKADILYGHSVGVYRNEFAGWLMNHMPPLFWVVSSLFALGFEIGAPLLFMVKRLRWVAIASGIAMHLVIAALMKDLIFFSLQMITFYVVFLPDEMCQKAEQWFRRRLEPLSRLRPGASPTE